MDRARASRSGVRSIVAVPLQHGGAPWARCSCCRGSPRAFDAEDMHTLELVSVAISASMSHAAEFEALSRFRTIFEGASVGIVRVGADGRALEINAAVQRMLGYTSRDHTENSFELFTHPDDLEETLRFMRELMAGERERYEQDKRYIRKDGEQLWVHVRGWLEPPVEGEPRTAIAMIENINERKLAEIALRENAERLERLVATQRDIAAAGVDLEGVMQLIVERSQALTRAEGALVSTIEGDELVVGAASGIAAHLVGSRRPIEESVGQPRAAQARRPADRGRRVRHAPVQRLRARTCTTCRTSASRCSRATAGRSAERDDGVRRAAARRGRPAHARAAGGGARLGAQPRSGVRGQAPPGRGAGALRGDLLERARRDHDARHGGPDRRREPGPAGADGLHRAGVRRHARDRLRRSRAPGRAALHLRPRPKRRGGLLHARAPRDLQERRACSGSTARSRSSAARAASRRSRS